jgi:hypothetical protein
MLLAGLHKYLKLTEMIVGSNSSFFLIFEVANDNSTQYRDAAKLASVLANHRSVVTHRHERACADTQWRLLLHNIINDPRTSSHNDS